MPIGSAKIGVLGAGTVPGGCQTFNASGTFSVPPGVSKVNITGKGGVGNPGNPGNKGNDGNFARGGSGGGASGAHSNCNSQYPLNPGRNNCWIYFYGGVGGLVWNASIGQTCAPNVTYGGKRGYRGNVATPFATCIAPSVTPNTSGAGGAGAGGTAGNAGQAGQAGQAGNPGNASSGLCKSFPGGAGGAAGNAGAAGNGGSSGTGGGGGTFNAGAGSPGGSGGNGGGSGGPSATAPVCPDPGQAQALMQGGTGGGGAGVTNDGGGGNPGRGNLCPNTFPLNYQPFGGSGGTTSGFNSPVITNCAPVRQPVPTAATGGIGGNPSTNDAFAGGPVFCAAAVPPRCGPPYLWKPIGANTARVTGQCSCSYPSIAPLATTNPGFRSGSGGGGGAASRYRSGLQSGTGGGGGGRGNAGNAGGSGGTGGTGQAATPTTFNCVPVTPGSPYPITVAPGGQVVISWNPQ